MTCGRKLCKRAARGTPLYCRCGLEFCSEACFVSEWHADHQRTCPCAAEIKRDVAEKRSAGIRGGTLLVASALSKTPPTSQGVDIAEADATVPVVAVSATMAPAPPDDVVAGGFSAALPSDAVRSNAIGEKPWPGNSASPAAAAHLPAPSSPVTGFFPDAPVSPIGSPVRKYFGNKETPAAAPYPANAQAQQGTNEVGAASVAIATINNKIVSSAPTANSGAKEAGLAVASTGGSGYPANADAPASLSQRKEGAARKSRGLRRYDINEFHITGENLGGGSYGQVTKAVHRVSGDVYALKSIPKKKIVEHQMEQYLMREVKTQINLVHPNVLRLHYYFEDAQNVLLLLEFASGGSLFSALRRRPAGIPDRQAAEIFVDVASALDYLHKNGIIHRDLKPENILMCDGGVAKLADFGWCAELRKDQQRNTFCGTWDYLSPEMVNSEPHDLMVDVWATGVLLYELLTGQPPFAASSQLKVSRKIQEVDFQVPDKIEPLAKQLMVQLLRKEPRDRLSLVDALKHPWIGRHAPARLAALAAKQPAATYKNEPRQATPVTAPKGVVSGGAVQQGSSQYASAQNGLSGAGGIGTSQNSSRLGNAADGPGLSVMPWQHTPTPQTATPALETAARTPQTATPTSQLVSSSALKANASSPAVPSFGAAPQAPIKSNGLDDSVKKPFDHTYEALRRWVKSDDLSSGNIDDTARMISDLDQTIPLSSSKASASANKVGSIATDSSESPTNENARGGFSSKQAKHRAADSSVSPLEVFSGGVFDNAPPSPGRVSPHPAAKESPFAATFDAGGGGARNYNNGSRRRSRVESWEHMTADFDASFNNVKGDMDRLKRELGQA